MSYVAAQAQRIADDVLFPAATSIERSGGTVPRTHIEALAAEGLFGAYIPRARGGLELPESEVRELYAILGGGCAATAFVWMQHQSLVRKLLSTTNAALADELLPELAAGRLVAGDVNYLRRRPPVVVARRSGDGFRLDGLAPWVASWGIADCYIVAAVEQDTDEARYFVLPAGTAGLRAVQQLEILAVRASSCVRLQLDGVQVGADRLVESLPWARWRERDQRRTAQPMPPVFGIAERAVRLLGQLVAEGRCEGADAVAALAAQLAACKARSWALADEFEAGSPASVQAQLAARAQSHELALRITGALVAAGGGRSVEAGSDAQRLLREAAFFSIQSQNEAVRAATLEQFATPARQPAALVSTDR